MILEEHLTLSHMICLHRREMNENLINKIEVIKSENAKLICKSEMLSL